MNRPAQDRSDLARWWKGRDSGKPIAARIWAKYPGTCRSCGRVIGQGERIYYDGKDNDGPRTWHEDCLPDGHLEPED